MMLTEQQKRAFFALRMNGTLPTGAMPISNIVPNAEASQGSRLSMNNDLSGYSLMNGYNQTANLGYVNGFDALNNDDSIFGSANIFNTNNNQLNLGGQMVNNIPALPTVPMIPTIHDAQIDSALQPMYAPFLC